jgi:hypothetical protein
MTDEEIQAARNTCAYFTTDRSRAVEWPHLIHEDEAAFVELCRQSEVIFIRSSPWNDIIGSNYFAKLFYPTRYLQTAFQGRLGSILGCELVSDMFCNPNARDNTLAQIYYVPRAPQ